VLIFLTGFMGAGKTTAGKKVAALLNYTFIDLDALIEKQTGKTIRNYFPSANPISEILNRKFW
jgi:shikimate kinase